MKRFMSGTPSCKRRFCRSLAGTGLPFCKVVFPDEEVSAFTVCDISPPLFSDRDRFAEDTTVFEISDLRIVTKICVGAQIMSDYCCLM